MSPATRMALSVAGLFVLLAVAVSLSVGLGEWQIQRAQHNWCNALTLLTSKPVTYPTNAAKNPSRVGEYELYEDFVHLRQEFRC